MNLKNALTLSLMAAAAAVVAVKAKTAATSIVLAGGVYSADFGGQVPIPGEYRATARRAQDEAGSPQSILLYAAGTDDSAWTHSSKLDDGSVLVEVVPLEDAAEVRRRTSELEKGPAFAAGRLKRLEGLRYPALASTADGRVSVSLVTPHRLVRVSAARWTAAFDAVVRGYKDAA